MDDFSSQRGKKIMSTNFNGVADGHNSIPGGTGEKKWRSYKLLIDPILKKGQQKLYRYDGVAPGPSGADFSVTVLRDPRSRLSRFWKGREKYDLPVPKFKYDKYYVGELPPKQCTITNLNDNVREAFLRNMFEKFGTIEDISICFHPKTRKHLGLASVTFSTTRAAKQAVTELNRTSVMGKIIIVQIDAGGTEYERIYDCLVNSSTPSSSSSTPRDPRHGLATPDTPTPRSGSGDPRKLSVDSKTPLVAEGTPLSMPDHQFAYPEPPPVGYPMGSDQGFPVPPGSAGNPGLSSNFANMNMQELGGNHSGPYPQDFNRGGMEQFPPHGGNFMPAEHHGMFQRPPPDHLAAQQGRGLPPGFQDPNANMPFPSQMPPPHGDYTMPMQPGFHPGHPSANYNMYQDNQAWDHQNYGQQGTGDNFRYSNQQQGYGNQGRPGQWDRQFDRRGVQHDFQSHRHHDSDSSYSRGNFSDRKSNRDRSREADNSADWRTKTKSRTHQRDSLPTSVDEDSNTVDMELATERAASTPVQDEEEKLPPAAEEEAASETSEPSMSLDSRIEALLQRQSGMGFGFELDSSASSGQGDSTSNNAASEFSPCPSPADGDSPLLDEGNRTGTVQESSSDHSPFPRYDNAGKHREMQDTSKHKSRTDKPHLERQLGHASYKRLQHSREDSTDRFAADDSCSRDSVTSLKSTPEIRDTDKASTIPSGSSTPTVSENTGHLNIGSLISRGLSNLRNIADQAPSPAISGSPFVEHQGSVDESLGSTPVESEPQSSRLFSSTQSEQQVQIEIADALASRTVAESSPSDMDVDDDRMSMSSISSGEDTKLEVNIPVSQPNEPRSYGPPMLPPPPPPSTRSSLSFGQWPGSVSLPGYSGPFSSAGPANFQPGLGFSGIQSQFLSTNPYAIPSSINAATFPTASMAQTASLPNQFMNQWTGMGMTPAQFGQMPTNPQQNPMQMMARLGGFPMPSFNLNQPGFPPGQNPFQDQARMPATGQANQLNTPWPGPMPPTPQFQQFLQQFPQQFQTPPMPNAQSEQSWHSSPPKADPREELISELLKTTYIELKKIMKKDLGRKMVESSAFKSLEAWWDDCERKSKEPLRVSTDNEKPSPKVQPSPLMSFSFRSSSWNQGLSQGKNLGLESIGLGLGVRATMPRMPSFKVKRKVAEEEEDREKKPRAETPQLLDEDASDTEQDKYDKSEKQSLRKPRKSVISDDEEDDYEEDDAEKISKEVDLEDEDEEDEELEESDSDYEDEISMKSGSESSEEEEEEEEDEASDVSESEESSSESEVSSSEESDLEDEAKDTSRKDSKAVLDIKREEKLARIPEEGEEDETVAAEMETVKDKSLITKEADKKAVNGDVSQKESVKDKMEEKKSKTRVTKEASDKADSKEKPSEKSQESVQDSKPDRTSRLNSFEMLVELATKARTELLEDAPKEVAKETMESSKEMEAAELLQTMKNKGLQLTPSKEDGIRRQSAGGRDAEHLEMENIEEEVVMESVEDMELEIGAKKGQKAALPKETADEQQPLPFLDHSYCQRPPPSPIRKTPPKDTADPVRFSQPTLKLVKLDLSDQELPTVPKATEAEDIIDVVSEAEAEVSPKKQKSAKRKHPKEEPSLEEEVAIPEPSKPQFMPRNYYEEWGLLYQILAVGIDQEDSYYLRKSYESMLQEGQIPWLSYTHWVSHPLTAIPDPPKKKRKVDDVRVHATGSARTEGFYKITTQEKKKYLARLRSLPQETGENNEDSSVPIKASGGKHMELSREARSDQRRAMATLTRQDGAVSDLLKFNQLKFRKKDLKFLKSGIHGWGLYAMQPISADEMVIEYVGESIRQSVADEREMRYEKIGIGSSYLFRIDSDSIIDATKTGNLARFINHSCMPNCYAKIISMESQKKIVIYSKQNISTGEEITYDYKFPIEDEKIPCLCGTAQCRGTLN